MLWQKARVKLIVGYTLEELQQRLLATSYRHLYAATIKRHGISPHSALLRLK